MMTREKRKNKRAARPALVLFLVLIMIGGGWKYVSMHGGGKTGVLWALRPARVMAAEIIQKSREIFLKPGTIYHQKTKQYANGGKDFIEYEYWQEIDSGNYANHVTTFDGSREGWQIDDLKVRWDIDVKSGEVRKDVYVYDEKNTLEGVRKARNTGVDLATKFEDLIENGTLTAVEGKLDTRDVYVVTDTRETEDKYWDILTFDRRTFQLLQTEKYEESGGAKNLKELVIYEIQEALPSTPELGGKLFSQSPIDLTKFTVLTRKFSYSAMSHSDYVVEGSGIPTTTTNNNWRTYEGKTFSFQYPNGWADMVTTKLATRTEVVSDDNLVIGDGQYFNRDLNRAETYREYIQEVRQTMRHIDVNKKPEEQYVLGKLKGIKFVSENNAGRTVVNIVLSDSEDSTRIFSLIYSSGTDEKTANEILNSVLMTFKFI